MKFPGNLYPLDDKGTILLTFRDIPGLEAQGTDVADAEEKATAALEAHLTTALDSGTVILPPSLALAGDAEIEVSDDLAAAVAEHSLGYEDQLSDEQKTYFENILSPVDVAVEDDIGEVDEEE